MSIWSRVVNAYNGARIGWQGGLYGRQIVPHRGAFYGGYEDRVARYTLAESYYSNEQYEQIGSFAPFLKSNQRLYKFIRSIFNPVQRHNNVIVSYAYRGTINLQDLTQGALPLLYENAALELPLTKVIKWSNLDQQLDTYVRDAALLGDAAWWVVSDPLRGRVRLELLDPAKVRYVERDEVGNIRAAVIEYEYEDEPDVARYQPRALGGGLALQHTRTHTRTLKVDKEKFETFRDGEPFAYYFDESGAPVQAWDNRYGFVPLKLAYYAEGKDGWGRNAFFGAPRRQIDELNDQASIINDSIRNVVIPLLQARGITAASEVKSVTEDRDSLRIVYLSNEKASLEAVNIPLDIGSAAANRETIKAELEANMPELALLRVRELGSTLSGKAIENLFSDATNAIKNVRKNLDPGIAQALQMAVTMGAVDGCAGFEGFSAASYDSGAMELQVADRSVIDDTLSKDEKLQLLAQIDGKPPALQRLMLREMGYGEKDIDAVVAESEADWTRQPSTSLISEADAAAVEKALAGIGDDNDGNADTPV